MIEKVITYLFDLVLQYQERKGPVSNHYKGGEYIGSGEGTINGTKIKRKVHHSQILFILASSTNHII